MVEPADLPEYKEKPKLCYNCGKPIKFIRNPKTEKNMPCDYSPIKVITTDGRVIQAYTCHWETCACPTPIKTI